MRLWPSVGVLVLVVAWAGIVDAAAARGARARRGGVLADPDAVTGRITAVAKIKDKTDTVIVVKARQGRGIPASDTAVIANADTKVTIEGEDAKLEDIKPGSQAKITAANGTASKIDVVRKAGGKAGGRKNN